MNSKKVLYCLVLCLVFYNFRAWIFIAGSNINWGFILGGLIYLLTLINFRLLSLSPVKIAFILLSAFCYIYNSTTFNLGGIAGTFLNLSALYVILLLKIVHRIELVNIFDKIMYYVTIVSVAGWILYLARVPLPYFNFTWQASVDSFYIFKCYYIFLYWDRGAISDVFPRFSSIFYEPGYYAIILVFLILYHRFDFHKRQVIVYTVALVLSFSLAGYLMFFIMWIGLNLLKDKRGLLKLILIIVFINGFYSFFKNYNGGNNPVNEMVLVRMEFVDGEWSGYNRTRETFDDMFDNFVRDGGNNFVWGVDRTRFQRNVDLGNVGWKVYLYKNGFVCFLAFILCVLIPYLPYKNKIVCILPLLLFILMFARGHLVIWYSGYWLLYIGCLYKCSLINNTETKTNAKEYM